MPCHPGRPNVGLCAHYETKPPLAGVLAVEALNGGSKKGEDARVAELMAEHGYAGFGGSDSHLVSFVGICATAFEAPILERYEAEGNPYHATARLWDDGIIDPLDTRRVLSMGIEAAVQAPIPETRFGAFRV